MSRLIYGVTRALAWFGGAVLTLIAILSCISIIGRTLSFAGLGPVPGDFELVEAGTALAVFSFLPWAHMRRGHATVDLFWNAYPASMKRALGFLSDLLMLAVWLLLVWRMWVSMVDYRANGEVTFILQFPVWWGYAASMVPAAIGCLAYAWRLLESAGLAQAPAGFEDAEVVH
jgi:TRAP-type C4-dicarboxylate transport system permease small subunit